ncbi:MAG: hypothetical protein GX131_13015 [candidate division WS1 bacterium]|nr:hypothetical protein [candidate division WS1 bacterium]
MAEQLPRTGTGRSMSARDRKPLLYAVAVLLALMLVLSATGQILNIRPAALVGFPIILTAATALILVLLAAVAPDERAPTCMHLEDVVRMSFLPAIAVSPETLEVLAANEAARALLGETRFADDRNLVDLLGSDTGEKCRGVVEAAVRDGAGEVDRCSVYDDSGRLRNMHLMGRTDAAIAPGAVVVAFAEGGVDATVVEFTRVQERLMSNISHELRTPLNVVMGFSELLTTGTLGEMPEAQLDAAQECHIGGERILDLINDIIDVGRSRSYYGLEDAHPVSVAELVRRLENLLAGQARREDIRIETDLPDDLPLVNVEERPLKQLIYHLLLASVDRSKSGDTVKLSLRRAEDALLMQVTDAGPALKRVPGPQPLEAVSEEEGREALAPPLLGLPLCATLADMIGGTLSVSTNDEGVHFVFELPLAGAIA